MRKIKLITGVLLLSFMLTMLASCGGSDEAQTEEPQTDATGTFTNGEYSLTIPEEYTSKVTVETPENDAEGRLFVVSETASIEAAKAQGEDVDGPGWLFSIGPVEENKAHEMMAEDMSGADIFAKDGEGNYFVYYHPSDVRLVRADNKEMDAAMDDWTALNEWAATVKDSFVKENKGLTADKHSNTSLDIDLARIAYVDGTNYNITSLESGEMQPKDVDSSKYVDKLINGVTYEEIDGEAPDGEYIVLNFPDEDIRYDFFKTEQGTNTVRRVAGDMEQLYKATFEDESLTSTGIMQEWYDALVEASK